jgi:hypothetical protein
MACSLTQQPCCVILFVRGYKEERFCARKYPVFRRVTIFQLAHDAHVALCNNSIVSLVTSEVMELAINIGFVLLTYYIVILLVKFAVHEFVL